MVSEMLRDVYRVTVDSAGDDRVPLAGYTYARGRTAVVFSNPQYGPEFERFTIAHEIGHLVAEFLPRMESRQGDLFAAPEEPYLAQRDPPAHIFIGEQNIPGTTPGLEARLRERAHWLREVVANSCAAELLAPHRIVAEAVTNITSYDARLVLVQTRFGVSKTAAAIRLDELGFGDGSGSTPSFSFLR